MCRCHPQTCIGADNYLAALANETAGGGDSLAALFIAFDTERISSSLRCLVLAPHSCSVRSPVRFLKRLPQEVLRLK